LHYPQVLKDRPSIQVLRINESTLVPVAAEEFQALCVHLFDRINRWIALDKLIPSGLCEFRSSSP